MATAAAAAEKMARVAATEGGVEVEAGPAKSTKGLVLIILAIVFKHKIKIKKFMFV